jgi:hypothetical protein
MDNKLIDTLKKIAEQFGTTAKKVNESSKLRKTHSENAIKYINLCQETGEELFKDIKSVGQSNKDLRKQDTVVRNTCIVLKANIERQKNLITSLKTKNIIQGETADKLLARINEFEEPLKNAIDNITSIIDKDNTLILLDNLLIFKKEKQQEKLTKLKKLADIAFEDAEKAIQGSSATLERGLSMVENFNKTDEVVAAKNREALKNLIDEANRGWNTATNVNLSSRSQYEFAEQVNRFTSQLFTESINIKDLVIEKHHVFEQNLQTITVLTVIISLKFLRFLSIEEIISEIEETASFNAELEDLKAYINIACSDIRNIAALNYDMTDTSHLNNEIEDKSVKSTKKETEYYDQIRKEVAAMTEATAYPVEGSGRNIENGRQIEELLKSILAQMN